MTTESQAIVAAYAHALMQAFSPASPAGCALAQWLHWNQRTVGLDLRGTPSKRKRKPPNLDKPLSATAWRALGKKLAAVATSPKPGSDAVTGNIAVFADALGFDEIETAVFRFVLFTDLDESVDRLASRIVGTRLIDSLSLMALAIGQPSVAVSARLQAGPLKALNLVATNSSIGDRFSYYVPYNVVRALGPANSGIEAIERSLIGAPMSSPLRKEDYAHIAAERDFILRMLSGALAAKRKGVNILIHGAPGTGKSEFCKVVAQQLGCALFGVGEVDEDGQEPSRWDRLDALRLADRLASGRGRALLLFDEMEDILAAGDRTTSVTGPVRRAGSKVFFNRVLEQNQVPVLWTANTICEFDPAFLRRMTFAFEMKALPIADRARLWEGFANNHGLALPAETAEALARRHKVSPGLMTGAVQAVAMAGGRADEIDFVVETLARPFVRKVSQPAAGMFQAALANADVDLARLQAALCRQDAPRDVSLCLHGPPGTGKSAFARQLAAAMQLEPMLKRGSDLLSMWIGETEKKLAAAFEEARQDNGFLIIDEAEGFLWSRSGATKSWEVSMVNELLVQMENHPLPFACTTNHLDSIDPAALRRFAFKVKFDFMTPAQAAAAYRQFFDAEAPPALGALRNLTPGDFAVVAKKRRYLEQPDIVRLLEQEVAAKNLRTMKIGF